VHRQIIAKQQILIRDALLKEAIFDDKNVIWVNFDRQDEAAALLARRLRVASSQTT
jgi:hypothetical protein